MGYLNNSKLFEELNKEYEESLKRRKRSESIGGIIPSLDFNADAYLQFLNTASLYELENDILKKETVRIMAEHNTPQTICK